MNAEADEQDLVKALDSVAGAAASIGGVPASSSTTATAVQPASGAVESPFPGTASAAPLQAPTALSTPYLTSTPAVDSTSSYPAQQPVTDTPSVASPVEDGPLASIKQDALVELRPLVDKLNLSSEERFDTYLLLIRSTDDKDLIGPAHEAAKAIEDETKRAEALLNIIKEIDYLSRQK